MANTAPTKSKSSFAALTAFFVRLRWWGVLLLLIVAVTYYFLIPTTSNKVTSEPRLSVVTRGDIENTVTAAGSLTSKDWVDIGAQVSGQLDTIAVEIGDLVTKGLLLAEIDATVQLAQVNASRASLNALESQQSSRESKLKLAKLTADRQGRMIKEKATSEQDYDNAQNALIEAQSSLLQLKSQIAQSEAGLSSQEAELGYTKIYAPMNGTVVTIAAKEGQTLNANQQAPTILTIADLTVMTVEAEVSEADIGKLKKNMPVYFSTLGGGKRRWKSHIRQILPTPTISNNVVLYTVLFDIDNSDNALLSQMTAQVFFVTSSARNVISVPVGALTYVNDGSSPNKPKIAGGDSAKDRRANMTDEQRAEMRAARSSGKGGGKKDGKGRGRKGESTDNPAVFDGSKPRRATVQREVSEGVYETVEVKIGVVSRVSAEVISGLSEGDRVVSGIIQHNSPSGAKDERKNNQRIPRGI
ncbi:efflux RND transporter periplasmic adaptor subunit [Colwellia sp. 6_MG-2023]|uniref:efflux RND transporter periplasmic adaptor subunit n=1 Tax=Colwellia sp. 6_MG-2023 TaxID=3062676 RepID=UPI0026E377B2|nr:efflux RND transporter periplasmic adaptor subunit [Colwellia sp. 6_MG-2023]MDO6487532.1 efflux RND transporter periplasmic adaptor subunit [Colwellia sp. 6_MG-2023]